MAEVDRYRSEGETEAGGELYRPGYAGCHEGMREEGTGPYLDRRELLAKTSDGFLVAAALVDEGYCHHGETDAPALGRDELDQVVAHLRATAPVETPRPARATLPGRVEPGRALFAQHCRGCHGVDGGGDKAPALNNQALLASATDGFLMATIARGRPGTAMPSWGPGGAAQPPLEPQQIRDLVAFVRAWQRPSAQAAGETDPAS